MTLRIKTSDLNRKKLYHEKFSKIELKYELHDYIV